MYEVLQVLERRHATTTREMTLVLARCLSCGVEREILEQNVRKANRRQQVHCLSCAYHRMSGTRPWGIWRHMIDRCSNPRSPDFAHYGGRGVAVSPEWLSFETFWHDMQEGYSDELTIERKDVNGPYSKANCRWASNMEQQANKRTTRFISYKGEQLHLAEFCRRAGVGRGAITPYLREHTTGDAAIEAYAKSTYPRGRKSRSMT